MIVREYATADLDACRVGFDVLGRVELQIDFEERERRPCERLADREFRVYAPTRSCASWMRLPSGS